MGSSFLAPTMTPAQWVWILALLTSVAFGVHEAPQRGLDRRIAYWASLGALAGGLFGGSVLGLYDYGLEDRSWNLFARGKRFCGGLPAGAVAAAFFLRWRKVSIATYGDLLVTALALGYAIGRIGCFFNGCDFGVVTGVPWAVRYVPGTEAYEAHLARGWITPDQTLSLAVHPVQLYSAACGLAIFCVLVFSKSRWPGARICQFAVLYGTYRFCMEFVRGDFHPLIAGLSLPQVFSILLITGGLTCALWKMRRNPAHSSTSNDRLATLPQASASS